MLFSMHTAPAQGEVGEREKGRYSNPIFEGSVAIPKPHTTASSGMRCVK